MRAVTHSMTSVPCTACGHHRHTDLYNKFLAVAEGKLEAFLESKGVTPADFYRRCREVSPACTHLHKPHARR